MRDYISAKFLLAAPPPTSTVVPDGFKITHCPARIAHGARKPSIAPRGDASTLGHAARTTSQVFATAARRAIRSFAAKGY